MVLRFKIALVLKIDKDNIRIRGGLPETFELLVAVVIT